MSTAVVERPKTPLKTPKSLKTSKAFKSPLSPVGTVSAARTFEIDPAARSWTPTPVFDAVAEDAVTKIDGTIPRMDVAVRLLSPVSAESPETIIEVKETIHGRSGVRCLWYRYNLTTSMKSTGGRQGGALDSELHGYEADWIRKNRLPMAA